MEEVTFSFNLVRKNISCCIQNENKFNYHAIEPDHYKKKMYFTPKRILIIQMK